MTLELKPFNGRQSYEIHNYCSTCRYKLPKEMLRCPECGQKVRTRPWHRPKEVDRKRV